MKKVAKESPYLLLTGLAKTARRKNRNFERKREGEDNDEKMSGPGTDGSEWKNNVLFSANLSVVKLFAFL